MSNYTILVQSEDGNPQTCCVVGQHEADSHLNALTQCRAWCGDNGNTINDEPPIFKEEWSRWASHGNQPGITHKCEVYDLGDTFTAYVVRVN